MRKHRQVRETPTVPAFPAELPRNVGKKYREEYGRMRHWLSMLVELDGDLAQQFATDLCGLVTDHLPKTTRKLQAAMWGALREWNAARAGEAAPGAWACPRCGEWRSEHVALHTLHASTRCVRRITSARDGGAWIAELEPDESVFAAEHRVGCKRCGHSESVVLAEDASQLEQNSRSRSKGKTGSLFQSAAKAGASPRRKRKPDTTQFVAPAKKKYDVN